MTNNTNGTPVGDGPKKITPPLSCPKLKPKSEPNTGQTDPLLQIPGRPELEKEGKGGAAALAVSNAEFVAALFPTFPPGARAAVCTKEGDPDAGGWIARDASEVDARCLGSRNNYVNCSTFNVADGEELAVRKDQFAGLHFLLFDDVGTKVDRAKLEGLTPTWDIETSRGNSQIGILLREPITDLASANRLLAAITSSGLSDPGASGVSRWCRLPVAINGKRKHRGPGGDPFQCRLLVWNPTATYSLVEIVRLLGLQPGISRPSAGLTQGSRCAANLPRQEGDDIYTPAPTVNPVLAALHERGLYKRELGPGKHDITCPWVQEHTDELDGGTAYFEPTEQYASGGFGCRHSHGYAYQVGHLLENLGVDKQAARGKAKIRMIPGEINRVNAAAEKALAARGNIYAQGGDIVTLVTDPATGDLSSLPMSDQALTKELAAAADWERFDKKTNSWVRCDPPVRNVNMLYKAQTFDHLLPLTGLVRQPFFRESNGELVCTPGYDVESGKYAAFDGGAYVIPDPTREAAEEALGLLLGLLDEFHFASPNDRASALSAILTAVVRPSLPLAPAFHVRAPTMGSGKSYLNEVIVAFATPGQSHKVSYPTTSEEATKAMPALLRQSPAVIEFDDMNDDWKPHGIINRMLTSEAISERVLGASKILTLSTRTLVLGSGNNVGPVRDLTRRVLTIHLDARTANPALLKYIGKPAELVRKERARFISAALTIIMAWRRAGEQRSSVQHIANYGDDWADHCRHPLIWLGEADPAQSLIDQVCSEPDSDALGELLLQWHNRFGDKSVTLRCMLAMKDNDCEVGLREALEDLPMFGREGINKSKLGWYLRKNLNRIVNGLEFRKGDSTERKAWRVCRVDQPGD